MRLTLKRTDATETRTLGELSIDGAFECYTLEDAVREGPKVPGATAIPAGLYEVDVTFSQRFKRMLPLVKAVPGFEGIRVHAGNTAADTEGCILVGQERGKDSLRKSQAALAALMAKMARPCSLEVSGPAPVVSEPMPKD